MGHVGTDGGLPFSLLAFHAAKILDVGLGAALSWNLRDRTEWDADAAVNRDWVPEGGEMNPFLHLSLHLAIHEQVSIDQPPGIRLAFEQLRARMDPHDAEHVLLECLGETIWQAQRNGQAMDAAAYVDAVRRKATLL